MTASRITKTFYYWTVGCWILILTIILIANPRIGFEDLATAIAYDLYSPRIDIAGINQNAKINLYAYISLLVILSSLTLYIAKKLNSKNITPSFIRPLTPDLVIIFILMIGLQTISHYHSFYNEFKIYQGKTTEQKNKLLWEEFYDFIEDCRKSIPGGEAVDFVTDLDMTMDPGMFLRRAMAYYLYPIDLLHVKQSAAHYLIILIKKTDRIPKDQQILISRTTVINGDKYFLLLTMPKAHP